MDMFLKDSFILLQRKVQGRKKQLLGWLHRWSQLIASLYLCPSHCDYSAILLSRHSLFPHSLDLWIALASRIKPRSHCATSNSDINLPSILPPSFPLCHSDPLYSLWAGLSVEDRDDWGRGELKYPANSHPTLRTRASQQTHGWPYTQGSQPRQGKQPNIVQLRSLIHKSDTK